jgi:hypothetical protein
MPGAGIDRPQGDAAMSDKREPAGQAAIRRLIAIRAYEMWENQGRPHGCDLIHWRQAEQEVIGCLAPTSALSDTPPPAPANAMRRKRVVA